MDVPSLDVAARELLDTLTEQATRTGPLDAQALADRLYGDLRSMARGHRARWNGADTLNTTALIHEAYLKVGGAEFENRSHFLGVASRAMRHVLVGHSRHHGAAKRGGSDRPLPLDQAVLLTPADTTGLSDLDRSLDRLAAFDERAARVIELRYFGGFTREEVADALDVSPATVARDWRRARAWLRQDMADEPG